MLKIGDKVPEFNIPNEKGDVVSNSSLLGTKYIVFFYPKDDSPGCTKQACSVRDNYTKLKREGYQIFGVSPDKVAKHAKFIDKYELPYQLLADTEKEMITAFGVWGHKKFMGKDIVGVIRNSFIINELGVITNIIAKVKTKEHGNELLQAIQELHRPSPIH